jgi:cytochrome c biogenesis protein CcdA
MNTLLTYIMAIALIDSANPNAVAVQIYLLSTPKPIKRSLSFIAGDFLANLMAGLLITLGLTRVIFQILSRFGEVVYLFQFLLGIALVLIGCYFYGIFSQSKNTKKIKSPKSIHAFLLGVTIAFSEAPTALPYLAAIEKIAQESLSFFQIIGFLAIYNFIFVFPLVVLLLIYIYFQQKSITVLGHIQKIVNKWLPRIMRIIVVILGLFLIVDSIINMLP